MLTYYPREKNYKEAPRPFRTKEGEHVFSKGELEIADYLHDHGIDYHYEPDVMIKNRHWCPDFSLWKLNVYVEYQGMANDEKSRKRYAARYMEFKNNGYKVIYLYNSQLGRLGDELMKQLEKLKDKDS